MQDFDTSLTKGKHLTHICERWAQDRTDGLQYAFFNGAGYESWENIWGMWNQFTPRQSLLRIQVDKCHPIKDAYQACLIGITGIVTHLLFGRL